MSNELGLRNQSIRRSIVTQTHENVYDEPKPVTCVENFMSVFFVTCVLGLGAAVFVPYVITDGNMFEISGLDTSSIFVLFFIEMGFYFVLDVVYQLVFELKFVEHYTKKYNIVFTTQKLYLFCLFFFYASLSNLFLCILPAIKNQYNIREAAFKGFFLGLFSYGNLACVFGWSLKNYPLVLVFAITFSGTLFSCFSSVLTLVSASGLYNNNKLS